MRQLGRRTPKGLYRRPVASTCFWGAAARAAGVSLKYGVSHDRDAEQAAVSARENAESCAGGVENWQPEVRVAGGKSGDGRAVYPDEESAKFRNNRATGVQ